MQCRSHSFLYFCSRITKMSINGTSIQLHYQSGSIGDDADPVYNYRSLYRSEVRKESEVRTLRGCRFRGLRHRDGSADKQLRRSAE